jgi:hypothetical protein
MLRITIAGQEACERIVKLEGKLLAPWVDEVRGLFDEEVTNSPLGLDLSGLTYVDRPGTELLGQLLRQGIRIEACSPFIAELLQWYRKQIH